jgi:dienelactone hydrolase
MSSGEVRGKQIVEEVLIPVGDVALEADITIPMVASGIVLFAHGSGSGRHSPRNRYVASMLHDAGLGTVLVDLLTPEEERVDQLWGNLRFDIPLLGDRLGHIIDWLADQGTTGNYPLGLFGASTGAAAALVAAAARPGRVRAVVSRGGRPDLAGAALVAVRAPTLLIVGGNDPEVLELNRQALAQLQVEARLEVIPGAGHLFEEPGALQQVASLARDWFARHLGSMPDGSTG